MATQYWKSKNVLITGGTSGLGRALTILLTYAGANVAIVARTQKTINDLTQQHPGVIGIRGDIANKEDIYPIAGQVHSQLGDVDVLFNVASYLGATPLRLLMDTDCEDFEKVLETNVLGPFRLTKAIAPAMLLKKMGIVVNISSDAAMNAYPRWGAYATSKAATDHMSRVFDEELKNHGVRFLSIDPGDMDTPMHFAAVPDADIKNLRDPADSAQKIMDLLESENFSQVRRSI